jgi:glycosyltransferase involved in cell wall biosynthesis
VDAEVAQPAAPPAPLDVRPAGRPRLLAYTDNDGVGGAEMSLATLISALGEAVEPALMGTHPDVVEWIAQRTPGVPVTLLPAVDDKRDLRPIAAHISAVRRERPDIFHANLHHSWSGSYGLLGAVLAPGVRTVAVEHSLWPPSTPGQRRLRKLLLGRVDAHVAVSDRLARDVEQLIGRGAGSIQTIHNGVPDIAVDPLPRLRDEPTVGFVGRLATEKGVDLLLHALERLPGVAAVLVGDGPDRGAFEAVARELGVADRVVFTGWSNEVRPLLATFDVVVQPSRREGFGISVVEAMLAGVPVVATAVGGMGEVVVDGVTGITVPAEDPAAIAAAVAALLDAPDRRAEMGARGRERALERFTADRMAAAFARVYARVLS